MQNQSPPTPPSIASLTATVCRLMGVDTQTFGNINPDSGPLAGVG